ncbi:Methyltransferase type 11 [Thermomonospora curvata DSM 43183]|uniref:Methyltransferase type 11 n=1 Tax=Thermomonospora curvata (strain ATCC 19995 / DSM 43183 / JCM 3096 / KCTC 9072 / NBRC 15933 / NCIMB 10081 / Henssen B9) TaxID=471852 RepID=D1ACM6_THECD|nr:Methyltransferase type 11 [Thermomonospora curvata DSM 43183]PKK12906.1 MAG: methyltransferase type 11 [Thermomonospora sp. CIF 1]
MTVTRAEKIVREVGGRPERGGDPRLRMSFTANLVRLVEFTEPELDPEDVVLETCAGTAVLSRAIARRVRHVTALDLDEGKLAEGKREADRDALTNITFTRGDATALPYIGRSFTLLLNRFSLHEADDPAAVLRELVRVSRPGAGLVVADLVRPEDGAADPDRLERLRDPSHRRLLTVQQITDLITEAGAEVKRTDRFDVVRPLEAWLAKSGTPAETAEQIRAELRAELDGGPATGLRPVMVDGELCITQANAYFGAIAP